MFGGFWEWLLIILFFVVLFNADKVHAWIEILKKKSKPAMEMLEKGKTELEKKVNEVKEKAQKESAKNTEKNDAEKDKK